MDRKKFRRKVRKILRKQRRGISHKEHEFSQNESALIQLVHPHYYYDLMEILTDEELEAYIRMCILNEQDKLLISSVSKNFWADRISNPAVFDMLPYDELEEILNSCCNNEQLTATFNQQSNDGKGKMMYFLSTSRLNRWLGKEKDISEITRFFYWLYDQEQHDPAIREESEKIFQKIATLSHSLIAKMLQNSTQNVVRRILLDLGQDVRYKVCQEIQPEALYNVLEKSAFTFVTDYPTKDMFSLVYESLPEGDKERFFMFSERGGRNVFDLFDIEIITEFYLNLEEDEKEKFVKKIVSEKTTEDFETFYQEFSNGEKFEIYEKLLKDVEWRCEVRMFLERKESLDFVEQVILNYVTH